MKSGGFSLNELLIGLFISSLMIAILIHYYHSHRLSYYQDQQHINQAMDSALIASLMRADLQMAGFIPCQSLKDIDAKDFRSDSAVTLEGIKVNTNPTLSIQVSGMAPNYSLILQHLSGQQLSFKAVQHLKMGDAVMIADCQHAEVHWINTIAYRSGYAYLQLAQSIAKEFEPPVYIGLWREKIWSIRPRLDGRPVLYYGSLAHQEEISEEINRIEVHWLQHAPKVLVEIVLAKEQTEIEQLLVWLRNQ